MDGVVHGRIVRALGVHGAGLGRPLRVMARRASSQGRGRTDRSRQRAAGRRGLAERASARRRDRPRRDGGRPVRAHAAPAGARGRRRSGAGAFRRLVRALSALVGRFRRRGEGAARAGRARVRLRLPSSDPPDRNDQQEGTEQRPGRGLRGSRQPLGDREQGGRAHGGRSAPGHDRGFPPARRRRPEGRPRDRARLRDPVLARPPLADPASGVVPPATGRHAQVRREPAQALPGHLQRQLRQRGLGAPLGCAPRRRPLLGRPGREGVPGRQPAHEAAALLGVADPARCAPSTRR